MRKTEPPSAARALRYRLAVYYGIFALACCLPIGQWTGTFYGDAIAGHALFYISHATVLIIIWFLVAFCQGSRWVRTGLKRGEKLLLYSPLKAFLAGGAACFLCFSLVWGWFFFDYKPLLQDSVMQWFHAQIFAAGHLTLPAPSLPEFYESYHVILRDGKWYSQYPPGYSFVLALGMLAGVPWLVTPLLGAASVVIAYYLSKELFRSERVARISCVLVVCCNFMLLMSAAYMSHVLALICTNLAALCYMRAVKRSSVRYALLMGVATGCLFITRPYTAVAFMFPFMAHAAWQAMKQPAHTLKLLAPSILTFLPFMAVQGWFNWQTTGSPFSYGYTVRWGGGHVPGFHEGPWEGEHTPLRALGFFFNNFAAMNAYFFWLTVPSLLLLPLSLVLIRGNTWAKLGLATFFSLNVFYAFYFHQDFAFGPRLVYESVLFMVILTAHALVALPDIWRLLLKFDVNRAILRGNVVLWCGLLLLISYIYTMPYIVGHLIDNGYPAKMLDFEALEAKVQAMTDKKSIIFVDCNYHSAYSRNPQDEEAEILYLQSLGERNIEAMRHFPGRSYFLLFNSRELFPITENDLYPEAAKKLKKIRQHCWPEMHHAQ